MAGRDIHNIVEIMRNDFKVAFSNPIVTIVLLGLIILLSIFLAESKLLLVKIIDLTYWSEANEVVMQSAE